MSDNIDGDFIRKCLNNNERGDGILYSALHRNKFMLNKALDKWFLFESHHWELDHFNQAKIAVEKVAITYKKEADKLEPLIDTAAAAANSAALKMRKCNAALKAAQNKADAAELTRAIAELDQAGEEQAVATHKLAGLRAEYKAFVRRIERLRAVKGADNCLNWAHHHESSLACKGDEFDRPPMLLSTPGGVINLQTGGIRPGKPADMLMRSITTSLPTDYQHTEAYLRDEAVPSPCPEWEKFFEEIHLADKEVIDFHARYLGYTITGLTGEQCYVCCIGEGANGKGVMGDTIADILGPLSWDISPELILEQKNSRNSAGPSADLMSLMGRRMVIASETDDNRRISCAMIKKLTGQDKITARSPHEKYEITFIPCFKLIFRTNTVPTGLTKDHAMRRRLLLIHYPLMYVRDPDAEAKKKPAQAHLFRQQDENLRDRLRKEKSGILLWLLKNCLKYQRDGLNPPDKIRAAVEQLHREEDHLGRFLEECCAVDLHRDDYEVRFNDFYQSFKKWYTKYVDEKLKYFVTANKLGRELTKRGFTRNNTGDRKIYGLIITDSEVLYSG